MTTKAAVVSEGVKRRLPRAGWQDGRVVSQITHPSRLVGQSSGGEVQKHQLDTRVRNEPGRGGGGGPGLHLARVSFVVRAFGSAFTLDLRLNHLGVQALGVLVRRAQHTVHSETKYIELAVVNDHQLFLQLRKSVVLTSNFAKSVVNLADMIYKEQLNTRIVLVAMETWASEDRIRMGEDSLETLNEFVKYRREGLAEQSDTVHLFSVMALVLNPVSPYEPRGVSCREAVNECDIPESCTGDSSQCPPNLHKLDGYFCENEQGRCYGGRCKTRDRQCNALWGRGSAERFCYEKLNVEGTERGNCGREGLGWLQCNKQDVLCGFLLCANISGAPRLGELSGEIAATTFFHQNRYVDCRGGHVQLVDGSDLSYVEDGTPCGPGMLCLDHKCLPATAFNFSSCPGSWDGKICFDHGVCSNEGKCICRTEWTGKDCSVYDPIPEPKPTGETERYKGPSGTNIIIGSIAGAVLVAAIVLGGTGWGFK
ncbi:disintegrin and metalloproteinase domain-containing protein 11 [Egretta garzetta]|uniref:disintegrin and metalloproteinase domain-containing protein 11 n=1 Tax=Egretta garzetta TaxID=188379 RepID=UPI00051F11B9|nr:disintegrin and metalloproteinase domain-containing protein 11 [Egretta garzetta]